MDRQTLTRLIAQTEAEVLDLAAKRAAAYETSPGNNHMAHVYFNAQGYHCWFQRWNEARLRLLSLERQLEVTP